jgi:hypothetical protein
MAAIEAIAASAEKRAVIAPSPSPEEHAAE